EGNLEAAKQFYGRAVDLSYVWQESAPLPRDEYENTLHLQAQQRAMVGLARICESKRDLKGAAGLYQNALDIEKKFKEPETGPVAATKAILATLYFQIGKRAEAEQLMKQALDYQKTAVGLVSVDTPVLGAYNERAQSALATYS